MRTVFVLWGALTCQTVNDDFSFPFIYLCRFSIAWWAYTFPMSAAAIASIHYAEAVPSNITRGLAVSLALIASVTIVGLSCVTLLHAVLWRSLFPNDMAIAITATKHHGKIHITKRKSDLSNQSIQTQSSENSNRLLDFTICVKPDLVFEKNLSPNLGKLFTISSVNSQSSSALDTCERWDENFDSYNRHRVETGKCSEAEEYLCFLRALHNFEFYYSSRCQKWQKNRGLKMSGLT